jgi:hypothetical protein
LNSATLVREAEPDTEAGTAPIRIGITVTTIVVGIIARPVTVAVVGPVRPISIIVMMVMMPVAVTPACPVVPAPLLPNLMNYSGIVAVIDCVNRRDCRS